MARMEIWFVYVESKEQAGKMLYHSETTLGEAEAQLTANDLVAKGSKAFICNKYVGSGFFAECFDLVRA